MQFMSVWTGPIESGIPSVHGSSSSPHTHIHEVTVSPCLVMEDLVDLDMEVGGRDK